MSALPPPLDRGLLFRGTSPAHDRWMLNGFTLGLMNQRQLIQILTIIISSVRLKYNQKFSSPIYTHLTYMLTRMQIKKIQCSALRSLRPLQCSNRLFCIRGPSPPFPTPGRPLGRQSSRQSNRYGMRKSRSGKCEIFGKYFDIWSKRTIAYYKDT